MITIISYELVQFDVFFLCMVRPTIPLHCILLYIFTINNAYSIL